jgi:hypothetical protein
MEDQRAALGQLRVVHGQSLHHRAIPRDGLNIDGARRFPFRFDEQLASMSYRDLDAIEQRCAEIVFCTRRIDSIKTKGADDKPRRHLPAIFIACHAVRLIVVHRLKQATHTRLRLMWSPSIVIEDARPSSLLHAA